MASSKITVTVEINTEKIEKLCDALKGLQTYKLAENDDRTLVVMDDVAEVLADYITTYTERKTGKWIGGELGYCTCCGHEGCASDMWDRCEKPHCPNCGLEVEGVQT